MQLYSKYPMLEAEVVFACRSEYACTAVDVLARRTRLAFLDAYAAEQVCVRETVRVCVLWGHGCVGGSVHACVCACVRACVRVCVRA